jgi:hypothetical protein
MGLLIERIHLTLSTLEGKNVATKRPPEDVDRILYLIILDLFNKHIDNYVKTKKVSAYLLPFKRQAPVTLTAGVGSLPDGFAHHRVVSLAGKEIDVVEDKFWNNRVNSKLRPVTTYPICKIENDTSDPPVPKIEVAPSSTAGPLKVEYFKYPTQPVYAYTVNGSRYVYSESESVDVEFPIGLFPEIITRLLGAFGIVLREGQLFQISEQLKTQEQAK